MASNAENATVILDFVVVRGSILRALLQTRWKNTFDVSSETEWLSPSAFGGFLAHHLPSFAGYSPSLSS